MCVKKNLNFWAKNFWQKVQFPSGPKGQKVWVFCRRPWKKKVTPKYFFLPVYGTIFSPPFFIIFFNFLYIFFHFFFDFFFGFSYFRNYAKASLFFLLAVCKKPKLFALLVPRGTKLFAIFFCPKVWKKKLHTKK